MIYYEKANALIDSSNLTNSPSDRITQVTKDLLERAFVIDSHTHFFDTKCINKSYFLMRTLKDSVGMRGATKRNVQDPAYEREYRNITEYQDNWENDIVDGDQSNPKRERVTRGGGSATDGRKTRGLYTAFKTRNLLSFTTMKDVYLNYINNFSLGKSIDGVADNDVLTTALMMDFKFGWDVDCGKSIMDQVQELKALSNEYPVLPFLFCDPRRADLSNNDPEQLYNVFNTAFNGDISFFGVKVYPALGYDPSDYRLWPIYKLCEAYNIPVLTHCGGNSVSTDNLNLEIYSGDQISILTGNKRQDMADSLNDPNRWALVLEMFPNLKLNFGHYGGYETWDKSVKVDASIDPQHRKETIFKFMHTYKNVFADFSYNIVEEGISKNLKTVLVYDKVVRERTLFGSDYWVVNKEKDLVDAQTKFLNEMDADYEELGLKAMMTKENPMKYFFGC